MKDTEDTRHRVGTGRDGRVLVISMERAAKRNAIDRAMADALDEALNELDDDDQVWAGVLTGGADVFSAGSDLTAGGDYVTTRGGEYGIIRRRRRKPLIAAVEGPALGGGLEIVLACDLVVAATDRPVRPARGQHRGGPHLRRALPGTTGASRSTWPVSSSSPAGRSTHRAPTRWVSSTCSRSPGMR